MSWHRDGSHCDNPTACAALGDRRQRAREAFWDTSAGTMTGAGDGIEAAIETATRVQITPELIRAAQNAIECYPAECDPCVKAAVRAAFEAAGFEVEQ